jgi:NAD+ synthase
VDFIKRAFSRAGFSRAVIALSGGIDSATSCALAVRALGAANIFPVLLPYAHLNDQGTRDAELVVKLVRIPAGNCVTLNIAPIADAAISLDPTMDQIRRGNIMARSRMMVLFDQAKNRQALVIGTENKTEHLLGYYTRFGDEASDVEPLRNLYKTQIYTLAKFLEVPEPILTKKPTAGLWVGQTDEAEFGFTYADADEILSRFYDQHESAQVIAAAGFSPELVQKVLTRATNYAFKHELPIVDSGVV